MKVWTHSHIRLPFMWKNMECEILEKLTGTGTVGVQESAPILAVDSFRMGRQEV